MSEKKVQRYKPDEAFCPFCRRSVKQPFRLGLKCFRCGTLVHRTPRKRDSRERIIAQRLLLRSVPTGPRLVSGGVRP